MPTARPSISARESAAVGMSTNAAATNIPSAPMPTPMPAVMMGRPAATTAPKVMTRMRNATPMPMISGRCGTSTLYPG